MNRATLTALLILMAIASGGCSTPIYIPTAVPTIMPKQARDLHIAAMVGTHGLDGNISYTPTDEMVLVAGGSYKGGGKDYEFLRHKYAELMAGWYSPFPNGSVALMIGGGAGTASASCTDFDGYREFDCDNRLHSGGFLRYIVQGNIGFSVEQPRPPAVGIGGDTTGTMGRTPYYHESGLATRLVLVSFGSMEERLYTRDPVTRETITGLPSEQSVTAVLIEPTFYTRWRSGTFGMEGQIGAAIALRNKSEIPVINVHLSCGIFLHFGK